MTDPIEEAERMINDGGVFRWRTIRALITAARADRIALETVREAHRGRSAMYIHRGEQIDALRTALAEAEKAADERLAELDRVLDEVSVYAEEGMEVHKVVAAAVKGLQELGHGQAKAIAEAEAEAERTRVRDRGLIEEARNRADGNHAAWRRAMDLIEAAESKLAAVTAENQRLTDERRERRDVQVRRIARALGTVYDGTELTPFDVNVTALVEAAEAVTAERDMFAAECAAERSLVHDVHAARVAAESALARALATMPTDIQRVGAENVLEDFVARNGNENSALLLRALLDRLDAFRASQQQTGGAS